MAPNQKDGGYGWIIVATCFIIQFIGLGINTTFGLFYEEISKEYPQLGKGGTSWIPSIFTALAHAIGPVASILVNKFGLRIVSTLGTFLTALGFGLSYFAQDAAILYLTIGIAGGIGMGLLYLPSMVAIPQYFDKKLAFAFGIAVSGAGVGTLFFEWIIGLVLFQYNWREGLLIAGALFLICLPFGLLYRPFKTDPEVTPVTQDSAGSLLVEENGLEGVGKTKIVLIDLNLCKNILFVLFSLADLSTSFAYNIPQIYLPEIEHGITKTTTNSLLGFIAVPMVCSRLLLGYLSDKQWVNRYLVYTGAVAITGIATLLSPQLETIAWLRVYCGFYGACIGVYLGLKSVILVDLVGPQKLTDAFGLILLVQAVGMFFGAPVAGYFFDIFGSHATGFYFAGGMFFVSAIVLTFIPFVRRRLTETGPLGESGKVRISDIHKKSGYSTFNN